MIADVTRPAVRRFDLPGDLLPREDVTLDPSTIGACRRRSRWAMSRRRNRHAMHRRSKRRSSCRRSRPWHGGGADGRGGGAGVGLRLAGKSVLIVVALTLAWRWFWRLGFADKVLWSSRNLDGAGFGPRCTMGRPALRMRSSIRAC